MNSFFEVKGLLAKEQNSVSMVTSTVVINKSHKIFEGHFPGQPVVPGVCMIQIVKEILESHLNRELIFSAASNIKFLSVINPEVNNQLNVEILYRVFESHLDVDAKLFLGETVFFKVKGSFNGTM